ncbi:MAG: ROK family protein [Pseudomonadales bacterium]
MTARIGIDLGGTKISGVVLGADDAVLTRLRLPTPRNDYVATLAAISEAVAALERGAGLAAGDVPVGIGTPGAWHPRLGAMKNCNSTWLNDRPLLTDLEERLGARARLANDADCLALSEAADGAAAGASSVFGVILGTGVGGGLVANGGLVRGPNGLTGEWGHQPLPYFRARVFVRDGDPAEQRRFQLESALNDRSCYCGRRNCIETFLSGHGLQTTHLALWGEPRSSEDVAGADDAHARSTMALYRHMLARSLAQVVNVVDPAVLVLGGGLSNVPDLAEDLAAAIPAFAFWSLQDDATGMMGTGIRVAVRRARWGDDSGVRGAARLWSATNRTVGTKVT